MNPQAHDGPTTALFTREKKELMIIPLLKSDGPKIEHVDCADDEVRVHALIGPHLVSHGKQALAGEAVP